MSSSRISSLHLLTFAFLLQAASGAPPFHICSNSAGNVSAFDHLYPENIKKLIDYLSKQAPSSGFGFAPLGRTPNQVYGLALCRGDVSTQDCENCIVNAGNEIRDRCRSQKGAIIWYDDCLLKYSNTNFLGKIDYQRIYMSDEDSVSNVESFNQQTKEMLSQLANYTYSTPKLYASGEMKLDGSQNLYGLTQCTRDLSSIDCKNCLDTIIGDLPSCCNGKGGGRVLGGSCNFRYETHRFVNT